MLEPLPDNLPGWPLHLVAERFSAEHHGDYPRWAKALADLPPLRDAHVTYEDTVRIDGAVDEPALRTALEALHPWRKGPFQIGPVRIDTEWRSDLKWRRLADALGTVNGRVLDIGCGNGYFGWRLLDAGADEVIGVDPTLLFCMQHLAIQNYTSDARNWVLPLGVQELPATARFETVLSMGVIYHRRDPQQHVRQLVELTAPGGRIVLESLVVEGTSNLVPTDRYARMRNVWCVPTPQQMCDWLQQAGCNNPRVVDVSVTTTDEQRSTHWMRFESLVNALDSNDPTRTVEGHPAPRRAIVIATTPQ